MKKLRVKRNALSAPEFLMLWKSVWENPPTLAQTQLALEHTVYSLSVYDDEKVVGMARMIGDYGLCYYIKDVIVRPEYQHKGIGKMLVNELLRFIRKNALTNTDVFVELCAVPEVAPFYEKLGFSADRGLRLKRMCHIIEEA